MPQFDELSSHDIHFHRRDAWNACLEAFFPVRYDTEKNMSSVRAKLYGAQLTPLVYSKMLSIEANTKHKRRNTRRTSLRPKN
jgi:hypothetical protein